MKIIRANEGEEREGKTFTGVVQMRPMLASQTEGGISITIVRFENGARTFWHDHPGEQVLYILEGAGRVGAEGEKWEVVPGDIIYTGPGERHWHGAMPGKTMVHISITTVGSPHWHEPPEDN